MKENQIVIKRLKKTVTWLGRVLAVLSVIFLVYSLCKVDISWDYFRNPYKVGIVVFGLSLLVALYNCINAYIWKMYVMLFARRKVPTAGVIIVYLKSNIAKYLPGNIVQYVGRNILGKKLDIEHRYILLATIMELISLICGSVIFALVMSLQNSKSVFSRLWSDHNSGRNMVILIILAIAAISICVICLIRKNIWKKVTEYLNLQNMIILFSALCLYTIVFLISALVLFLIFLVLLDINISYVDVASANALSWLAGYIVPGAPGGIGIREVVLIWLLDSKCLPEQIMLAAVLLRICAILGDFLSFSAGLLVDGLRRRKDAGYI